MGDCMSEGTSEVISKSMDEDVSVRYKYWYECACEYTTYSILTNG